MYEADIKGGRLSIAPEKLMRAMLLQVLYSVSSERQLVEQIQYDLLFRWFVGLAIEDSVWHHSVFSKSRDRLIEHDAVTELFNATVAMAAQRGLLSGQHVSVDSTLIPVLTDNRHGLVVIVQASSSDGKAERGVAAQMLADVAASSSASAGAGSSARSARSW